ncbi:outer membrane lipoprotein LolB [Chitinilyticum litopenaei]|uniref:outer membrane lipoprotein LolB n=1 Tax=Chitinilyticum litopenaei TaxID=1121276 RepID=UPI000403711C|nr:outer membrane lipoprotein LolB [Chitinilyticum litopenaei]
MLPRCLVSALALLLCACAQLPPAPTAGYALSGRLSIREGNSAQQALFSWQSAPDEDRLSLDSPLGQTLALLTIRYRPDGQAAEAILERGGEAPEYASDPRALLLSLTGLDLPLNGLRWWLQGEAAPFSSARRDEQDGIVTVSQDGWTIVSQDYRPLGKRQQPFRLNAQRDEVQLRIVISEASTASEPEHALSTAP